MGEQPVPLYDVHHVNSLVQETLSDEYASDDLNDIQEKCCTIATVNTYYSQVKLRSAAERAVFYHATFGFPSVSTMYRALARHLTLPGLTHHEFADNAPKSVHTVRGHLHELPQGQGSTKPVNEPPVSEKIAADPAELEKLSTELQLPRKLTPGYIMDLPDDAPIKQGEWYVHHTGKLTADATGRLPVASYLGHTAIWVAYHPHSGYIRAIPIKSKSDISRTLEYMFSEQVKLGHRIDTVFIDNEVDNDARAFFARSHLARAFGAGFLRDWDGSRVGDSGNAEGGGLSRENALSLANASPPASWRVFRSRGAIDGKKARAPSPFPLELRRDQGRAGE